MADHHAIKTTSGQRAGGSAIHKGHRRIASDIWVDPRAAVEVSIRCQYPNQHAKWELLTGMKIWVIVMSKTMTWQVVLAWSHVFRAVGSFFSRLAIFGERVWFQAQRFW
jgi:hypothetical protein